MLTALLFLAATLPVSAQRDPIGYLDRASQTELYGWACDPDTPSAQITVEFWAYSDDPATGIYLGEAIADHAPTEEAVIAACENRADPRPHRYSWAVPNAVRTKIGPGAVPIFAVAVDSTAVPKRKKTLAQAPLAVHFGKVGVFYRTAHTIHAAGMARYARQIGQRLDQRPSVEELLRTGGSLRSVYDATECVPCERAAAGEITPECWAGIGYWQEKPQKGYSCLHRAPGAYRTEMDADAPPACLTTGNAKAYFDRIGSEICWANTDDDTPFPGEGDGCSCKDAAVLAALHAQQLLAAGVDHVFVNLTDIPYLCHDAKLYYWAYRPTEVLFREWARLRSRGIPTPSIAVWVDTPPDKGGVANDMYQHLLDLYDRYPDLLLVDRSDPGNPRKLFLVVDRAGMDSTPQDRASVQRKLDEITGRGYAVVKMWFTLDAAPRSWMFMSTCRTPNTNTVTNDVVDLGRCNQAYTPTTEASIGNSLGSQVAVSPSYQTLFSNISFAAAGRLGGLTYARQFERALQVQPHYLLAGSWNEHVAGMYQRTPPPGTPGHEPTLWNNPYLFAMGFESDDAVPCAPGQRRQYFVDTFGSEYNRDLEPVVKPGGATGDPAAVDTSAYDLLSSCLRVYRTGATTCSTDELCCRKLSLDADYHHVFSLNAGNDWLLTSNAAEKDLLRSWGWYVVPTHGEAGPHLPGNGYADDERAGLSPPLILYSRAGSGRMPIYRCYTGVGHFISPWSNCEGTTTEPNPDMPLGFTSTVKTSATLRKLSRCYSPTTGTHRHTIGPRCPAGFGKFTNGQFVEGAPEDVFLGYVR